MIQIPKNSINKNVLFPYSELETQISQDLRIYSLTNIKVAL